MKKLIILIMYLSAVTMAQIILPPNGSPSRVKSGNAGYYVSDTTKNFGIKNSIPQAALDVTGTALFKTGYGGSLTDSSILITSSSGQPQIKFYGTDGDEANISISTSDQLTFNNGASYLFDKYIYLTNSAAEAYLYLTGAGSGYVYSAIVYNNGVWTRGAGTFYNADDRDATIFWGKPYASGTGANAAFVVNKAVQSITNINSAAAQNDAPNVTNLLTLDTLGNAILTGTKLNIDSLTTLQTKTKIDSATIISLPTGVSGWGTVMIGDNQEYSQFRFTSAGVVTLINNSTNVSNTAFNANTLNIYDAGSGVAIQNYLAAGQLTVAVKVEYYAP